MFGVVIKESFPKINYACLIRESARIIVRHRLGHALVVDHFGIGK